MKEASFRYHSIGSNNAVIRCGNLWSGRLDLNQRHLHPESLQPASPRAVLLRFPCKINTRWALSELVSTHEELKRGQKSAKRFCGLDVPTVTPEKSTNPVIHHPLEVNSLISFSPDSPMLHPSTRKETNKVGTPSTTPFSRLQRLPNYLSATFLILVLTCIEISGLSSSPKQDSPEKREYWCPKMPTRYEPHTEIPVFDERQFRDAF